MTVIAPSIYYQLARLQPGTAGSGNTGSSSSGGSLTQSLVNSLENADNPAQGDTGSAYALDLSPAAQLLLNNSNTASASNSDFTLTQAQQKTIEDIVAKYKGQPLTQATFNDIQNALEAAGLGPDQLSALDQITSFNSTSALINDLNGNFTSSTPATSAQAEHTKAINYMQSIINLWKSGNGTTATASGS